MLFVTHSYEPRGGKICCSTATCSHRVTPLPADSSCFFFSQPCQTLPRLLFPSSPPFQKLEDWIEALSLNQELGIPLPAELDDLHQRASRLYMAKDGSPSQSTNQSSTSAAAPPGSSCVTGSGT